jgi:hypothetical protein
MKIASRGELVKKKGPARGAFLKNAGKCAVRERACLIFYKLGA